MLITEKTKLLQTLRKSLHHVPVDTRAFILIFKPDKIYNEHKSLILNALAPTMGIHMINYITMRETEIPEGPGPTLPPKDVFPTKFYKVYIRDEDMAKERYKLFIGREFLYMHFRPASAASGHKVIVRIDPITEQKLMNDILQ